MDLQNFLPSQYTSSEALGIDANGDIVGLAWGSNGLVGIEDAILLVPVPVPEPSTFALAGLGVVTLLGSRRLRRRSP